MARGESIIQRKARDRGRGQRMGKAGRAEREGGIVSDGAGLAQRKCESELPGTDHVVKADIGCGGAENTRI